MILSYIKIFRKCICIISDFFIELNLHPCTVVLIFIDLFFGQKRVILGSVVR